MSNSEFGNLKYYAGATSEFDAPMPYQRSQRSKQIRWGLMGLGALALAGGAFLSYHTFYDQYLNNRQVLQVQLLSEEIDTYHPQIQDELDQAAQFAATIGNQVADDGALERYNNLRVTAQDLLDAQAPWPEIGTKPSEVLMQREISEGILAANTSVVNNFELAEQALTRSHAAWQLEQAKAPAQAAADALTDPLTTANAVLTASEGIVGDAERAALQTAIDRANAAVTRATGNYTTADQYVTAQAEAEEARTDLMSRAERVFRLIPVHPQFITVVDEEGNESQIPNPDYVPPVYIPGLSNPPADGEEGATVPATDQPATEEPVRG